MDNLQVLLAVSVPALAVLIGILMHHSRLTDLRARMDVRFAALEKLFDEKLMRVEKHLQA